MSVNNELLACYKVFSLLEKASENTESMLDHMPGVMVVLNKSLHVIRANLEFAQLADCSMEETLGFDFGRLFDADNAAGLQRNIAILRNNELEKKQINFELEMQPRGKQQSARQFYWQASIISANSSAEGQLISVTGKDLSELYQSEMKLKSIFSNLPLGMLMIDREGKIRDVLSQFSEVVFNSSDLVGKDITSLFKNAKGCNEASDIEGLRNLISCFGQSKDYYSGIEETLPRIIAISDAHCAHIKWVSVNYQPVLKSNVVDSFILMFEDATEAMNAKKEMDRVSELERQIQTVYEAAIRDPVTGLYTRLYMKESMKNLTGNFHRGSIGELAILMLDIDYFKNINDTYGHKVGDSVLSEIGRIILQQVRETDVAIRYGGEEFLLMLPSNSSDMTSGRLVAERIRQEVASFQLKLNSGVVIKATISGGAAWCSKEEHVDTTIERADSYLYQAKRLGRNRVISEGDR